jgi:Family of unknown function (DUF6731)
LPFFKFGFFRADQSVGDSICEKLVEFAKTPRPLDETRTAKIGEDIPVLLRNILIEGVGTFLLDFTKIRDIPSQPISDLAGNEGKISFHGQKQRPAEYTCAIFDKESRVLVLEEHTLGISPSILVRYWQAMIPNIGKFGFDPIIKGTAKDQLLKAGAISKFSVKLASMGDPKLIEGLGLKPDDVLDLINFYAAPTISVILEVGAKKQSKSLNVTKIKALTSALLPLPKSKLKKLSLVTEDEAGKAFPIDLLKDRLSSREAYELNDQQEMTDELRYNAIRSAWTDHGTELRKRYQAAV